MSNNIVRHIINLVIFGTKQHVTSMQTPRCQHSNASLPAWKRIATMLVAFTRELSPFRAWRECGWNGVRSGKSVLRFAAMIIVMMVVGVTGAWGQTVSSGLYYIASGGNNGTANEIVYYGDKNKNNFYLCPTEKWCYYLSDSNSPYYLKHTDSPNNDNGMPFMTTYQCLNDNNYDSNEALWCIKKKDDTDYYYIIHVISGKYLTYNNAFFSNTGRVRVHLEDYSAAKDDYALYKIEYVSTFDSYDIISKYAEDNNTYQDTQNNNRPRKFLNVNKGNRPSLVGTNADTQNNVYCGGIIGFWSFGAYYEQNQEKNDQNSRWQPESTLLTAPTISDVDEATNKFTITDANSLPDGYTIRYTTGDGTQDAPTATTGDVYEGPVEVMEDWTVKAVVVRYGLVLTSVNIKEVLSFRAKPVITYDNSTNEVTISSRLSTPDIYYTIDGTEPDYENYGEEGNTTLLYDPEHKPTITNPTTIKVIAVKNTIVSEMASGTILINPTITLTTPRGGFIYNGTEQEPAVSVKFNGRTISASEYEVSYSNNTIVGTATVNITNAEGGDYIVYGSKTFTIGKAPLTVTANNHTITYGDVPANDGVTYTGFVNNETSSVLGGTLAYAYDYTQYADVVRYDENNNVVPYTITPSGLNATNYEIAFKTGTLTVAPKDVGLTWVAETSYPYDGAAHAPTATPTSLGDDVVNGDNVTGVTVTLYANTGSNLTNGSAVKAGYYRAIASLTGTKKDNYKPAPAIYPFAIAPKSIGDGDEVAEGFSVVLTPSGSDVTVSVTDGGTPLVEEQDYTVTTEEQGLDNYIIVQGIGNYGGSYQGLYVKPVFYPPTGAAEYAAVYQASSDLAKPTDITPYIVKKVNPSIGTISIAEVAYLPENVPVLLLANSNIQGFIASAKPSGVTAITAETKSSNLLKVAPAGGLAVEAAQIYMFYNGEFVLTKAGTLSEGKYYLYNPNYKVTQSGTSSSSALQFVVEETTGIVEMSNEQGETRNSSVWYMLDGRRLNSKPTQQGLYIWNGRKTIIK